MADDKILDNDFLNDLYLLELPLFDTLSELPLLDNEDDLDFLNDLHLLELPLLDNEEDLDFLYDLNLLELPLIDNDDSSYNLNQDFDTEKYQIGLGQNKKEGYKIVKEGSTFSEKFQVKEDYYDLDLKQTTGKTFMNALDDYKNMIKDVYDEIISN